ncbi:hypothetical protein [Caldimonas brevitalea]|uniref:Uncharacterized protein n=1 Tax=Caldimonas brevitalea TaxID=413882 RepID=A0A0G3BNB0_9BURK|nr:hypothetical protein [Caldimonas brevitalea]AKJ28836.1 hypothetical protein AAW51_2145 [Caldimonas brevitalea]
MTCTSSTVLSLAQPVVDKTEALAVLESLRDAVERGEIKAFACVGLASDHSTRMWSATVTKTTRLELIGAMTHMLHCYEAGRA